METEYDYAALQLHDAIMSCLTYLMHARDNVPKTVEEAESQLEQEQELLAGTDLEPTERPETEDELRASILEGIRSSQVLTDTELDTLDFEQTCELFHKRSIAHMSDAALARKARVLATSRRARFQKLLELNAPSAILRNEAELTKRAEDLLAKFKQDKAMYRRELGLDNK